MCNFITHKKSFLCFMGCSTKTWGLVSIRFMAQVCLVQELGWIYPNGAKVWLRDTSTALMSHPQITAGDNCAHKILESVLIKSSKSNTSFWVITEHELANSNLSAMHQIDKSRGDIWIWTNIQLFEKSLQLFTLLCPPSAFFAYLNITNDILPLWKCPAGFLGHLVCNKALAFFSEHLLSLCSFFFAAQSHSDTHQNMHKSLLAPDLGAFHQLSAQM